MPTTKRRPRQVRRKSTRYGKEHKIRETYDEFQNQLNKDINKINNLTTAVIPADKTTKFYKLDKAQHDKLLQNSITAIYKKANQDAISTTNQEAKNIATELHIQDRTERIAERQAFISLKDHKDSFSNNPSCRLINPAKSKIGCISKQILENFNTDVRNKIALNQWKNSSSTIGNPLRQETLKNHQPRHRLNHALQKIPPVQQQHRLGEERQQQHVRCYNEKPRLSRSV